jgi:hypothetical protein
LETIERTCVTSYVLRAAFFGFADHRDRKVRVKPAAIWTGRFPALSKILLPPNRQAERQNGITG